MQAGDVIFSQGDAADVLYVILQGSVEIRLGTSSIESAGEGDIIGEMALIDNSTRSATAVALTDVTLAPVDRKRFLYLVQNTPMFALDVMKTMAARIRRIDAKVNAPPAG